MFNVQFVAHHILAKSGLPIVGVAGAKSREAIGTTVSNTEPVKLLLQVQIAQQMMRLLLLLLLLLVLVLLLNVTQVFEDLLCVLLIGIIGTAEEIRQLRGSESGGLGIFQITIHNSF